MANKSFKTTIGIHSTPEILNSLCSCLDCDSLTCFTQRQGQNGCACGNCRASQTCLFYTNKSVGLSVSQSNNLNEDNILEKPQKDDVDINEHLTEDISYDISKKDAEDPINKNIYLNKPEHDTNDDTDYKKSPHVRSTSLPYSRHEINPGMAKLSAQVMNVPYKNFKESLSYNKAESDERTFTKYDILKKIKEAYDACSCKVCECIGTTIFPVKNDLCRCKPCECQDCSSYLAKNDIRDRNQQSHMKCAKLESKKLPMLPTKPGDCDCKPCDCIKCSDSFSKPCDCAPCQCIECKHLAIHHQPRTLVVAPVGEEHSRNECSCSPCDCVQCGHFGVPPHLMQEMSTGINRHPNCHCEACVDSTCEPDGTDTCKCERQRKVMRKPVEKDTHDYDIRRVMVGDNPEQSLDDSKAKHDTIAMFAAMASTFPKFQTGYKHMTTSKCSAKQECKCNECECIVCSCKETRSSLVQKRRQTLRAYPTAKAASCSCTPCECLVCSSNKEKIDMMTYSTDCRCDICCCLNCKSAQRSTTKAYYYSKISNKSSSKPCRCSRCDCPDCRNIKYKGNDSACDCSEDRCRHCSSKYVNSNESLYPIKKGERLTPSIYNTKVNDSFETLSKDGSICCKSKNSNSRMTMRGSLPIYHAFSQNDYIESYLNRHTIKSPGKIQDQNLLHQSFKIPLINEILKCEAYTQYDESHKSINNMIPVDYEASGSYHSEYFSYDSTPKTSDTKDNSITPVSGTRNKSWESSCNSSGHENPDYIVSFPKSAEVGIRLAMQLKMDKDLNLERLNKALKNINAIHENRPHSQDYASDINSRVKKGAWNEFDKDSCHPRCNTSSVIEDKSNQDIDLVKRFVMGNTSKQFFHNIATKNFYPVPDVIYEPTDRTNDIGNFSKYKKVSEEFSHRACTGILSNEDDYKRVQNTLKEAKAFSFQLLQILENYEKANREFVSISQKLKQSQESLFNKNLKKDVNLLKMDKGDGQTGSQTINKPELMVQQTHVEDKQIININQVNVSNDNCRGHKVHIEGARIFQSLNEGTPQRFDLNNFNRNPRKEEVNAHQTHTIQENKYSKREKCRLCNPVTKIDEPTIKKRYKKYWRPLRRTIKVSKNINIKCVLEPKKNCVSVSTEISNTLITRADKEVTSDTGNLLQIEAKEFEEINSIAKRLNVVFGSNEDVSASTSADDSLDNSKRNRDVCDPTKTEEKLLTILNKKIPINTDPSTRNKGVCIYPSLAVDIKETVHSISMQTSAIRGPRQNLDYENKALVKLQVEVNELLNMPLLSLDTNMDLPSFVSAQSSLKSPFQSKLDLEDGAPINMKSSITENYKKRLVYENINCNQQPNAVDCSCEALKVGSLGVRKVSEHTVLVKWNAPQSTDNVNGYELLVDGRSVQKILSPSRCMAVVTCLPHSEKVLITIRTITLRPNQDAGHMPSTTVVYRRRSKWY